MAPRGTIPQRAAANCRLTRPISTMADVVPSPVSAAACSGRHQRAPRATGGSSPVKRLAEATFAATATMGVLRTCAIHNSRVRRSINT